MNHLIKCDKQQAKKKDTISTLLISFEKHYFTAPQNFCNYIYCWPEMHILVSLTKHFSPIFNVQLGKKLLGNPKSHNVCILVKSVSSLVFVYMSVMFIKTTTC